MHNGTLGTMNTLTSKQKQFFSAIPVSWQEPLKQVCAQPVINDLVTFLQTREAAGATIYPAKQAIFAALRATPFDAVKVVIVGQDPYHGPGQAHGLSFSVPEGQPIPPSLKNIYKELSAEYGTPVKRSGNLTDWAHQGVLLLNALLTVEQGKPASHAGQGWELFTDAVIQALLRAQRPIVFMLWGAYAQKKVAQIATHIDTNHLILKAAHPSPFSVTGFLGCNHFTQANQFLVTQGMTPIDWLG